MDNSHKYSLEKYRGRKTRHTCPDCKRRHEFTRYIVNKTGEYVADHVGICNRINKCGYHYPPSDFFRDNPGLNDKQEAWRQSDAWKTQHEPPQPKEEPIEYLPMSVLEKSLKHYDKNNLIRFLVKLFGKEKAFELAELYNLGSSKLWTNNNGYSVVFWQVDSKGNVRQAKVMAYDPATGKRLKSDKRDFVSFNGKAILKNWDANFQQCLFGEHLINSNPDLPIALVESEKTAVIMAGISPKAVWIATGGKNGARWTDKSVYGVFKDRQVILYPDLGAFNDWSEKAKILGTVCQYRVSDLLEQKATNEDRQEGFDIADYFIKEKFLLPQSDENELPAGWERDENGVLIDANELPAIWNLNPKNEGEKTAIIRELKFNHSIAKSL